MIGTLKGLESSKRALHKLGLCLISVSSLRLKFDQVRERKAARTMRWWECESFKTFFQSEHLPSCNCVHWVELPSSDLREECVQLSRVINHYSNGNYASISSRRALQCDFISNITVMSRRAFGSICISLVDRIVFECVIRYMTEVSAWLMRCSTLLY